MSDYMGIDMKEFLENGLNEVAGNISRRNYNLSIIKARQLADRVVKSYAAERNIEYTTFADTIESLYAAKTINMESRDGFHTIRIYGNKAVHENDDDPSDAENAYYLLRKEIQTFLSRKDVSVDRTPVRVERNAKPIRESSVRREGDDGLRRAAARPNRRSDDRRSSSGNRDRNTRTGQGSGRPDRSARSGRNDRQRFNEEQEERRGISIYDILRILIPIVAVILVVIIIRSLIPSSPIEETTAAETSTEAVTETAEPETTEPETTEPETEPPVIEYQISGDSVNIRYADNQDRIYTQLSNGTYIGTVTPIEGSDFVQFTLEGVSVVVRSDLIEPIETGEADE